MKNKRLKITIGTPSATEYLHRRFVQSLLSLEYPENTDVQFSQVFGIQLPFARNHIVQDALKDNSDYLFFIDADMIFPPDILIKMLLHDKDIINALAFRRIEPHYPCIFKFNEKEGTYNTVEYYGGLISVDATGMSCILIKTEVFKKMKQPWYYYDQHLFSSDLTFCKNALKLGYKVWIDTDLKIGHLGADKIITEQTYLDQLNTENKAKWNAGLRDFMRRRATEKELYHQE